MVGEVTSPARGTASALYLCCYYTGGGIGALAPGLGARRVAGRHRALPMALLALAADGVMARAARSSATAPSTAEA